MAYNDDAVLARLSALNESHDSIATAAQWIMFHRYGHHLHEVSSQSHVVLTSHSISRRHADRTVQIWLQKLRESPSTRRLNLIYLSNGESPWMADSNVHRSNAADTISILIEVVQQSKARHKEDFPLAFAPIIAEATSIAYKGATPDVQNKIRRVIEVWRDRSVFEGPIQGAIEARLDG